MMFKMQDRNLLVFELGQFLDLKCKVLLVDQPVYFYVESPVKW